MIRDISNFVRIVATKNVKNKNVIGKSIFKDLCFGNNNEKNKR